MYAHSIVGKLTDIPYRVSTERDEPSAGAFVVPPEADDCWAFFLVVVGVPVPLPVAAFLLVLPVFDEARPDDDRWDGFGVLEVESDSEEPVRAGGVAETGGKLFQNCDASVSRLRYVAPRV